MVFNLFRSYCLKLQLNDYLFQRASCTTDRVTKVVQRPYAFDHCIEGILTGAAQYGRIKKVSPAIIFLFYIIKLYALCLHFYLVTLTTEPLLTCVFEHHIRVIQLS